MCWAAARAGGRTVLGRGDGREQQRECTAHGELHAGPPAKRKTQLVLLVVRHLQNRVRWSGFGRSRFVRLFAFLGPRQTVDICRSRGLALLEKFVRSRHKPTCSRQPGKFAALPWCCRSVAPSGGNTQVPLVFYFQKIMVFSHGRANAPTCAFPDRLCWAVPCRGAHALRCKHRLQCPFRCRFFAPGSGNSTTRRRRVV